MHPRYFLVTLLLLVGAVVLWFEVKRDTFSPEAGNPSNTSVADAVDDGTIHSPGAGTAITFQPTEQEGSQVLRDVPLIEMPPQDQAALLEKARLIDKKRGDGVFRFAEPIEVSISPENDGIWETLPDGSEVWRLRIASPGASSLNLGFSGYRMPEGGRLSIFPPEAAQNRPIRDFTHADNEDHGQLWTPMLASDELVLEVTLPPGTRDLLALKVARVNHGFRKNGNNKAIGNNRSGSCNIDVACTTDPTVGQLVQMYADQIRSVGTYTLNGIDTCSGALINNTANDAKPYFLTAEHCEISPANAPSMVVYFNFENSDCRTPGSTASGQPGDGTLTQFNSGAIHRADNAASDFCLVELDDPVPTVYNVFYAGWDRSGANGMATGIHHPAIAEKRISFELDDTIDSGGTHVKVIDWDHGTTEGGSSGSPLFDAAGRIIGDLTGGDAACGNDGYDEYGRFSVSWSGGGTSSTRLSDWLDPLGTGSTAIDGINQDDALSIDNASITEGNSGTKILQFTVSLARETNETITVDYTTVDRTAVSPGDYTSTSDTLTFGSAETSKTISVTIVGETSPEEHETFEVHLSNPTNAQIADGIGVGTVNNDDFIVPEIISPLTVTGAQGAPFNYRITANNTPGSFSISNEPAGMMVNATSGDITWTPSSMGPFSVTIEATNSAGTDSEVLNIDVSESQLKQGLDTNRSFTEGTNIWLLETTTTHDGVDSARSPGIKNDQSAFFETQVTAPVGGETVTFWWKVSSEEGFDFLRFLAGGALVDEISGEQDWALVTHTISAGQTETLRWEFVKDESVAEGDDAGYIDELIFASEETLPVFTSASFAPGLLGDPFFFDVNAVTATSFSAVNLPAGLGFDTATGEITGTLTGPVGSTTATITATNGNGSRDQDLTISIFPSIEDAVDDGEGKATWTSSGNEDWFGQFATTFDGTDAAQSGDISHEEISTLQASVNFDGAQNLSFRWRVSSEEDYDFLRFFLNGTSGTSPISGETGWQFVQNVTIPTGPVTLFWRYEKDESESEGSDTGWVDRIEFSYQLGAVTNLSAIGDPGGGILLNWDSVASAQSYRIFRSTTNDLATASQLASPTATDFTDFTAAPGTVYYYWARAYNATTLLGAPGDSASATTLGIPPPANTSASDLEFPDKIRVAWDSVAGAESFRIYRNAVDNFSGASQITEISSASTVYDDSTATATPDIYYYWVTSTETVDSVLEESDPGDSAMGRRASDIHGNNPGTATPITIQSTVTGTLESGDADFFSFTLTTPTQIQIYTTGSLDTIGTLTDFESSVRNDPNADDDAGDGANFLSGIFLEAGDFTIGVGLGTGGNPSGTYTLKLELGVVTTVPLIGITDSVVQTALLNKIQKVKKSIKRAKKGGKSAKAKKLKSKFKRLKKQLASF